MKITKMKQKFENREIEIKLVDNLADASYKYVYFRAKKKRWWEFIFKECRWQELHITSCSLFSVTEYRVMVLPLETYGDAVREVEEYEYGLSENVKQRLWHEALTNESKTYFLSKKDIL